MALPPCHFEVSPVKWPPSSMISVELHLTAATTRHAKYNDHHTNLICWWTNLESPNGYSKGSCTVCVIIILEQSVHGWCYSQTQQQAIITINQASTYLTNCIASALNYAALWHRHMWVKSNLPEIQTTIWHWSNSTYKQKWLKWHRRWLITKLNLKPHKIYPRQTPY